MTPEEIKAIQSVGAMILSFYGYAVLVLACQKWEWSERRQRLITMYDRGNERLIAL